jgi:hypothetical protein
MSKKICLVLAMAFLVAFFSGCGSGSSSSNPPTDPTPKDNPSFASDIQPIFSASCTLSSCHNSTAQAGLNLSSGQAFANIVNVACTSEPPKLRVKPADPANSYIVIKLEGRQTAGAKMPLAGSISGTDLQNIKNWITKGAGNN